KLFFAGIVPGLLTIVVYAIYIFLNAKFNKNMKIVEKKSTHQSMKSRISDVSQSWPIILIAVCILGGIYSGIFTPTEAAAVGGVIIIIIGFLEGNFRNIRTISNVLRESANTTAMVFFITIGA